MIKHVGFGGPMVDVNYVNLFTKSFSTDCYQAQVVALEPTNPSPHLEASGLDSHPGEGTWIINSELPPSGRLKV